MGATTRVDEAVEDMEEPRARWIRCVLLKDIKEDLSEAGRWKKSGLVLVSIR
jgi:hypothetical protein